MYDDQYDPSTPVHNPSHPYLTPLPTPFLNPSLNSSHTSLSHSSTPYPTPSHNPSLNLSHGDIPSIDATLREAAKNQVWRRAEAAALGKPTNKIFLEPSDVRAKLMARKAGSLLIFAVDASGSMALNRMNAAKGGWCFFFIVIQNINHSS